MEGDLGVTGLWVAFKATRPDKTIWGEYIDGGGGGQDRAGRTGGQQGQQGRTTGEEDP